MNALLDACREAVRKIMRTLAKALNTLTGGQVSPSLITLIGLAMHVPIALLIATGYFGYAALLLVVFGLFDTLDGELARLQNRASNAGMLLDASTDRIKEVILYVGAAYAVIDMGYSHAAVWAVAACGASLCVSYIKPKGETAFKDSKLTPNEINRLFQDGLGRFEVRMFILVIGLLINQLITSLIIITVISTITATSRLIKISRKLS
jgi:phosphatidylglycerophosphate synthase